jgi:hypothetical protein
MNSRDAGTTGLSAPHIQPDQGEKMNSEFEGDLSLMEELAEQDFHEVAQHGGTLGPIEMATIIHRVSAHFGGNGGYGMFCTMTKECQPNCN